MYVKGKKSAAKGESKSHKIIVAMRKVQKDNYSVLFRNTHSVAKMVTHCDFICMTRTVTVTTTQKKRN